MLHFADHFTFDTPEPGVFERNIDDTFWGWNGQFGGYPLGLVLQACRDHVGDPLFMERSLTLHFLRRVPQGRLRIEVTTERVGRTVANLTVRMMVDGKLCVTGLALFATDRDSETLPPLEVPDLTPPTAGEEPQPSPIPAAALTHFDVWPRHEGGLRSGTPLITAGGWMRLKQPGGADERFCLMVADGYVPVGIVRSTDLAVGGTMDFTAHFQVRVPDDVVSGGQPVRVVLTTRQSARGYMDEDADIWTVDGQLLMRTHQVRYSERAPADMLDALPDGSFS